jgi:hypothetical protein
VAGLRGSFTFHGYVRHDAGHEWVWVYGGSRDPGGRQGLRAVSPDRIRQATRRRGSVR